MNNPCPPGTISTGCVSCGGRPICVEARTYRHVPAQPAPPTDDRGVPWFVGPDRFPSYAAARTESLARRSAGADYEQFRIQPAPT